MRSRFSAFALGRDRYLQASWHPATRPSTLELGDGVVWRRLQIVDTAGGGADDETGIVEFRASFRAADDVAGLLHERSRFSRADGRWVYVDGEILT
jgi:SEC-C motif-containing protein